MIALYAIAIAIALIGAVGGMFATIGFLHSLQSKEEETLKKENQRLINVIGGKNSRIAELKIELDRAFIKGKIAGLKQATGYMDSINDELSGV